MIITLLTFQTLIIYTLEDLKPHNPWCAVLNLQRCKEFINNYLYIFRSFIAPYECINNLNIFFNNIY